MEKSARGALYNAVGERGISLRDIAALISERLMLPVGSVPGDELTKHFDWMTRFIKFDSMSTSLKTQELLRWQPTQMGLLDDMGKNYF